MATLENIDGQRVHVLSVHFHHEHTLRREQWLQIDRCCEHLRGHVIMLADHNSLVVPARDANKPAEEKKNEILAARDTEVSVLAKMGLTDAWPEIHHASPDLRMSPPAGYTYGYQVGDPAPSDRSLKRLDRIHVSNSLKGHLSTAFTSFLCRSDHKALVVSCKPPVFHAVYPRFRCSEDFFADDTATESVTDQLQALDGDPATRWEKAHAIFRHAAMEHRLAHQRINTSQVLPLLLASTSSYVPPQGWKFLTDQGTCPDNHSQAYSALVSIYEKDESDKVGTTLLEQLKGLAGEAPSCVTQAQRTKQINKLMTELQARKRLGWVKSKTGQLLSDPLVIASALEQHWSGVTRPGLSTSEECHRYLDRLKLPPNFSVMARALFRLLTPALVSEALDRLHNSSSPGEDGVGAGFYKYFREFFEPLMFQLCDIAFNSGSLPEGWETGLINMIPKAAGLASIDKLRPIALQNVKKKWLMTIVAMQIEQIIQQLSHKQQAGCIKGRHMIQHIWGVKGGFESLDKGLLVSFDFSNAFPTLSHVFIEAVLHKIQIPPFHVHFILATLVAPYHFCVGKGIVREVLFTPGAGIGQGDPFCPLLFSFCASFVLFAFNPVSSAFPFMYVDDLCVLITSNFSSSLLSILDSMNEFGRISGLCLNLSKSAMVIKGKFSDSDIKSFKSCGLTMADSVRYLGVLIGHVTTAQAFTRALGEAQRRASQLSLFPLTLLERVQLLKVWILPVLLLTARAYRASEQEERSLKTVYNTALGFDSWGVTLTQLSLQPDSGGHGLAPPDTWLRVQSGLAFSRFSGHQSELPPFVTLIFRQWARKYGVV